MALSRRDFLRYSTAGAALGAAAPLFHCPFLSRPLQAAMMGTSGKKMLVIFLRGGADSLNMVIPNGDEEYNDTNRPTIFIPEAESLDLGNSFARAHPALAKLVDDVPDTDVAYLHRVGYADQSRSHFSSQQFWENAVPGEPNLEEGWVNRLVDGSTDLSDLDLPAASVSAGLQVLFRGPYSLAHIQSLDSYKFGGEPLEDKMLGVAPSGGDDGAGMIGIYSKAADSPVYDGQLRSSGLALAASLGQVSGLDPATYEPEGGATYPTADEPGEFANNQNAFTFFRQLKESVMLLKETECQIAGIELGSFDTHTNQNNALNGLLEVLAHGMSSVHADTSEGDLWDDLVVVTLSEFGRTSAENGSGATDHGEAGCMIVQGGGVNGGVYNCDSTTWADGDMFSTPSGNPRYVSHLTDYRAVLAEIVDKHFGESAILDDVIPGWDSLSGDDFDALDFLE